MVWVCQWELLLLDITNKIARAKGFLLSIQHNKTRRSLASNFFYLTLLQYASYVFPLLTIPYLTHVLGVAKFGLVAFALATAAYGTLLVNYGFSYSATRQAALVRNDLAALREVFSNVTWAKIILAVLGLALLGGIVILMPSYRSEYMLFISSYSVVIGMVLNCEWFFQGVEDMRFITIAGLISRTLSTVLVFVIIRHASDYIYAPLLTGLGQIIGGLVACVIIWRRYGIRLGGLSFSGVWHQLADGWDTFLSCLFVSLYTTSNIFVLGILTNPVMVGYYAAADKIVSAVRSIWGPVPQVLYPYFARAFASDRDATRGKLRKILKVTGVLTMLMSLAGCVVTPWAVRQFLGQSFEPCIIVTQVLMFIIFAVGINNILGVQGLLANNMNAQFRNIVFVSAVLNLLLLFILVPIFGIVGAAAGVVFVECLIAVLEWFMLRKGNLI